jgi:DNA-binding CsgD family transcriptional regulator/tetratricopeptide (TPR) repeat protein
VTPAPFVGRQVEMRCLGRELGRLGRLGRFVLVLGEAGIGKSRLLQEFATREQRRAQFLAGRGSPVSTAIPFSVLAEALESRLRVLPAARLQELAGSRLQDVAHMLPSAALALGGATAAPTRLRALEALRALLEALAIDRPLVLLLDDLHQADRSSWEALNYLARNPPAAAVLIVAAIRPDELFGVPELAALIATLLKDGLAGEIRLPALDPDSVAALAQRVLPATAARDTGAWLYSRARGNALYTVALLEELAVDSTRRVVPIGVQERVRVALMELPRSSRELVEAAAVVGHSFTLSSILTVVPGATAGELDTLVRRGLIVESARQDASGYDFLHPVVQEGIYAAIGAARRRELHQALARGLPNESLSARAYHAGLGAAPGDLVAVGLLRDAAAQAEREEAHRDALVHLQRAAAIAPVDDAPLRRELLDRIAWQASAAGEHAAGIAALEALAPLVAGDVDEAARTDVRLASFLSTGAGDLARAENHAVRAVRLLSARPPGGNLAAALNELAWIRGEAGSLSSQVARSRQAVQLAREAGAEEVLMHSLGCLGHALALMGESADAISILGESLGLAMASGDGGQVGWHTGCLAEALLLAGRAQEAVDLMDRLLGPRANSSDVAYFSRARVNWHLGQWDSVLTDVRTVQALNPTAPSVHSAWALSLGAAVLAGQGRTEEARSFLAQAERVYKDRPFYCFSAWHDWASGHAEWLLGDLTGARSRFERALHRLDSMGARAAADEVRPDLWQAARELGEEAPAVRDPSPLRRARELEMRGGLAEAVGLYARLPAPQEERRVLAMLRAEGPAGRRAARRSGSLSERERIVAELAAGGLTDRQIAARLHIGDRTVETHLAHVYAKLAISGRTALRSASSATKRSAD